MPIVAHYPFENDGKDISGANNHGTGNITYAGGQFGQAGVSDGTQHLEVGTLGDFGSNMGNGLTISLWWNSSAAQSSVDRILGVVNIGSTDILALEVRAVNAGDFSMFIRDALNRVRWFNTASGGWNDGVWHHVAVVMATTFAASRIYIDGVSQLLTDNVFATPFVSGNFDLPLYLFALNNRGVRVGSLAFSMDELWLFNEVLTEDQVNLLFHHNYLKVIGLRTTEGDLMLSI